MAAAACPGARATPSERGRAGRGGAPCPLGGCGAGVRGTRLRSAASEGGRVPPRCSAAVTARRHRRSAAVRGGAVRAAGASPSREKRAERGHEKRKWVEAVLSCAFLHERAAYRLSARLPSCLLSCLRCSPSPQRLKLFHFLHLSARCPVLPKELILRGEGTASVLAVYGRRELKLCWEQDLTLISPLGAHSLLLSLVLSSTRS